ncbi:MAG: hypothetical protein C0483_08440 [Pirellula sp.]|nr:hypothetical protein [Pirellula sp.]
MAPGRRPGAPAVADGGLNISDHESRTMPPEPLLLIGASVRAVAESAAAAGFEVGAIDLFGDADLCRTARTVRRSVRFPTDALRLACDFPPGTWLYTGGLENHPRVVGRLATQRPLLGNDADVICRVRDLRQLGAFLEGAALGIALPTIRAGASAPVAPAADGGRWLVKQRRSSGGLGVCPASTGVSPARGRYLQEFIVGTAYGATYLGNGREACFLGVAEQLAAPAADGSAPFRYGGSLTMPIDADDRRLLVELGARLVGEFALRGLFGVDLIRDPAGRWYLLEVNPRSTASMDLWESPGAPTLIARHVAACRTGALPNLTPPAPSAPLRARKVLYSGALHGRVPEKLTESLFQIPHGVDRRTVADIPQAGTMIAPDQPLVTIFATGAAREELTATLAEIERQVLGLFAEALVE